MSINLRELRRLYKLDGAKKCDKHLTECLKEGELKPEDVNIAELFEAFFGHEGRQVAAPDSGQSVCKLLEAADANDSTAFLHISERVIGQKIIEAFNEETAIAPGLIDLETNVRVKNERRYGLSIQDTEGEQVHEGMPYPHQALMEDYMDIPDGHKYGLIVGLTREALHFSQHSGELLRQAARVGERLGIRKDYRCWNVILGIANTFNWNGTAYNTYNATAQADASGRTIVPRNIHGWPLNTWVDIDRAQQLFDWMVDPETNEPIEIRAMTVLVMPRRELTARSILTATESRNTQGAETRIFSNPLTGYALAPTSRRARAILNATGDYGDPDGVWILGDLKKAFAYRENWPVTVTREPLNSQVEFEQDIVVRFKGSERGQAYVKRPHYVVISSGSCGHSSSGETICDVDAWPGIDANAEH